VRGRDGGDNFDAGNRQLWERLSASDDAQQKLSEALKGKCLD
jgi:hypothetical protein